MVSIRGLTEFFPHWRNSNHPAKATDHGEAGLPTTEIDSARRRTGPQRRAVRCSNGARRVWGLPVSLLWGSLPDREGGPEATRNEATVRLQKLPHHHLPPASGVGRGNGGGGRRPGEVLGDARPSLREPGIPRRPRILRRVRKETQAGREAPRAGGGSACPSGTRSGRLHEWRQERCQRNPDILHWRRSIRWLSGTCSSDRRARKGREGLTATGPPLNCVSRHSTGGIEIFGVHPCK